MKGDDIMFLGAYGREAFVVRVKLYWVDTYDVFVNKFLVGRILKRNGQWTGDFQLNLGYTAGDVFELAEMIENHKW